MEQPRQQPPGDSRFCSIQVSIVHKFVSFQPMGKPKKLTSLVQPAKLPYVV